MKRLFGFFIVICFLLCGCSLNIIGSKPENKIKQIAVGEEYSIFLTESGEVYSVGKNIYGNLGLGDTKPRYNPEKISLNEKIKCIGAGEDCAYAISETGNIYFWGSNRYGQMGNISTENQTLPKLFQFDSNIDTVSIGWNHILAKDINGTLYSWGSNVYNALGLSAALSEMVIYKPTPVFVEFLDTKKFKNISAGATSSMALSDNGELFVWGETGVNLLSETDYSSQTSFPIKVKDLSEPLNKTSTGFLFELVLTKDGKVYGRGRNEYCQISSDADELISSFHMISLPETITNIVTGKDYAFAVSETGKLYAWGNNDNGQLGLEPSIVKSPTQLKINDNVISVSTFSTHTFVSTKNGDIYAMGNNRYGQLNNGMQKSINTPVKVRSLSNTIDNPIPVVEDNTLSESRKIVTLSSGYSMSIALDKEGDVYIWGTSFLGCLGHGKIDDLIKPTKLYFPKKAIQVDTNTGITAILLENGDIYMCGSNKNYRLGKGSQLDMWIPVKIDMPKPVKRFFNGQNATFVQTEDNEWYVWGDNSYGVLATGDFDIHNKPFRIELPFKVNKISSHNSHSLFLDDTGTVYTWGNWDLASENRDLTFKKIVIGEKAIDIATSAASNFILTESGKIYAWGDNTEARLGLKNNKVYESPTLINTDRIFTKMAISPVFGEVLALTPKGTVYTWGYDTLRKNTGSEGGDFLNTPLQVELPEPIVDIHIGDVTVYAISESGAIYTWGGVINSPDKTPLRSPIKMQYSFNKRQE